MAVDKELPKPWTATPCIHSAPISRAAGCNIYLKLENLQPSGSFKSRGIGNLMFRTAADAASSSDEHKNTHFYCSSGGNAGLACATAAIALQRPATIVVPTSTLPHMVQKLRDLGADVLQTGANWAAADKHLREQLLVAHDPASKSVYVPPFDHPLIWAGVSTLVDELAVQMAGEHGGAQIDGVVCNVGGGGLMCGVMEGIERMVAGQRKVMGECAGSVVVPSVLAVETEGAESLNASVRAGHQVTLPAITTIATSLGATRVADKTFEWAVRGSQGGDNIPLVSAVVSDAEAVMGVARFLDDARMFVEVGCGATLVMAYNGGLRKYLGAGLSDEEWARKNIVLIVCGGSNISWDMLQGYRQRYNV